MVKRYRVHYVGEDSRTHSVGVWAADSSTAKEKVRARDDVDFVVGVRRANGPVIAAIVVLGLAVILIKAAVR